VQGCKNLRELLLWGNNIERIDEDTFAGLWSLRKLDLDRNQLTTLPRGAFTHLSNLEVVHLGENRIAEIHGDTFILAGSLKVTHACFCTQLRANSTYFDLLLIWSTACCATTCTTSPQKNRSNGVWAYADVL